MKMAAIVSHRHGTGRSLLAPSGQTTRRRCPELEPDYGPNVVCIVSLDGVAFRLEGGRDELAFGRPNLRYQQEAIGQVGQASSGEQIVQMIVNNVVESRISRM